MVNMGNYGSEAAERRGSPFLLAIGWISALISLIRWPFIFGVLGVVMGILATKNGSKGGLPLIIGSMALMAVGLIFNAVIFNYLKHWLGF